MTYNFTAHQAYAIAVRYNDLKNNDPQLLSMRKEDNLYHMIIHAGFLSYECYVGAEDGMIYGMITEPIANPMAELMQPDYRAIA